MNLYLRLQLKPPGDDLAEVHVGEVDDVLPHEVCLPERIVTENSHSQLGLWDLLFFQVKREDFIVGGTKGPLDILGCLLPLPTEVWYEFQLLWKW